MSDGAFPHRLAAIANSNPGLVWSESGPDFAYFYHGPVYMDHDQPYFYHRTVSDEAAFFRKNNVQWVLSHAATPGEWFSQHEAVSSGSLILQARARDGYYTLYAARRK